MKFKFFALIALVLVSVFMVHPFQILCEDLSFLRGDVVEWVLENPKTINKPLLDLMNKDAFLKHFMDSGHIRFQVFDSDKEEGDASLGFSYDYSKDISTHLFFPENPVQHLGLSLNFSSEGHFAYRPRINPTDFLDSNFAFLLFYSRGGAFSVPRDVAEYLNALEDIMAEEPTREEFLKNPATQDFARIVRSHLSTQIYTEFDIDTGLESNQTFDEKQYYYGIHGGLDIKAWNPDSALAQFNIFDFPFALTRLILGNDPRWLPRGSAFPTLLIGLEQVLPQEEDPRTLRGDDSAFSRIRFEASYRTLVGHVSGQPAFFEMNFRHYREIGASQAVIDASLDRYTYLAAALLLPKGMYVSYSAGRLPLDEEDDRVFELGFHYGF